MELLTPEAIRERLKNPNNRLTGPSSRYKVFEDGRQSDPTEDPPSVLLHLQNVPEDAIHNRDLMNRAVHNQVTGANFRLRDLGFDMVSGRLSKFWGNTNALNSVNEWNAAILKALGNADMPAENCTWFVSSTFSSRLRSVRPPCYRKVNL